MNDIGRGLIAIGIFIAVCGGIVCLLRRFGFRGLPGDVSYRSPNVQIYVPIVSCIVLSIMLSVGMWFFRRVSNR